MSDNGIWAFAVIIIGLVGYAYGWRTHPKHRSNCNECDADIRRAVREEYDRAHDALHRGPKAMGMPYPDQDVYACRDRDCPRNREDLLPPRG
jgi:hypothetical protein